MSRLPPIKIQNKSLSKSQPEDWNPLNNLIKQTIYATISASDIKNPVEFLFIVKNDAIINVFETIYSYHLTKNYKYNTKDYLSINHNNWISTYTNDPINHGNLNSIFDNTNTNFESFKLQYNMFDDYSHIVSCEKGERIDLFIYASESNNVQLKYSYSTTGNLHIYNNGIASTQAIVEYNNTLFANVNNNYIINFETYNKHTASTAMSIVHKLQDIIKKRLDLFKINTMELNHNNTLNALYIKIIPPIINKSQTNNTRLEYNYDVYIKLLKYIDYFYWYKSTSTTFDYELKKDYFKYGNTIQQKYFKPKYNTVSNDLYIHVFDFIYLMAFINNKINTQENELIKLCSILVGMWSENIPNSNVFTAFPSLKYTKTIETYITYTISNMYNISKKNNTIVYNISNNFGNIFGPFTDIVENIDTTKLSNSFVVWLGEYTDTHNSNGNIYKYDNYTVYNIPNYNEQEYNYIINYINSQNSDPYYISDYLIDPDCIDEYCNSKIGCFRYNYIENLSTSWSNIANNYTKIIVIGNINNAYSIDDSVWYTKLDNGKKTLTSGKITGINKSKGTVTISNMTYSQKDIRPNNGYADINILKSIVYENDVYISNSYNGKYGSTPVGSFVNYIYLLPKDKQKVFKNLKDSDNNPIKSYFEPTDIDTINGVLKKVDTANKQTPIGILEFVDSISKFGRINTFCHKYLK